MSNTILYTSGMQTLNEVVQKALMQSKKSRTNRWLFLELAIDALRYIHLHISNDGKEWLKVTPNAMNRVSLPSDFEDFIGLYEPIDGELWPLTRNDSIVTTITLSGVTESLDSSVQEGVDLVNSMDAAPYVRGGVNLKGYYTVDYGNQEIVVSGTSGNQLVLLYKTSGVFKAQSTTYVYNKYVPFIIAYICYEFSMYDDSYPVSRRQELMSILNTERNELGRLEAPTLDEFLDAIRSTYYSTAKR